MLMMPVCCKSIFYRPDASSTNNTKALDDTGKPVNIEYMVSLQKATISQQFLHKFTFVSTAMTWRPTSFTAMNTGLLPCNSSKTQEFNAAIITECVSNSTLCAVLPNIYKIADRFLKEIPKDIGQNEKSNCNKKSLDGTSRHLQSGKHNYVILVTCNAHNTRTATQDCTGLLMKI